MAKFCTNCGKKLVDGKPCDCEKKESKKVEEVEVVSTGAGEMVNDYIEALKGIFTKPVDTMKKYAKSSKFVLAMIMLGINAIVFGLYIYLFAGESVSVLARLMGYSSLMSLSGASVSVPASVFFWAFLFMAVFFFALGGLLYLFCGPIMKDDTNFKEIMSLIGVNAVFTTITILVALIFVYIKTWISLVILMLGGFIFILNTYHGFTNLVKIDKNRIAYVFTASYAITLFVVCYILPKIFM